MRRETLDLDPYKKEDVVGKCPRRLRAQWTSNQKAAS